MSHLLTSPNIYVNLYEWITKCILCVYFFLKDAMINTHHWISWPESLNTDHTTEKSEEAEPPLTKLLITICLFPMRMTYCNIRELPKDHIQTICRSHRIVMCPWLKNPVICIYQYTICELPRGEYPKWVKIRLNPLTKGLLKADTRVLFRGWGIHVTGTHCLLLQIQ